jgi:hypothetical protein
MGMQIGGGVGFLDEILQWWELGRSNELGLKRTHITSSLFIFNSRTKYSNGGNIIFLEKLWLLFTRELPDYQ